MKAKIIDILNKIANGEEPPKKIVYDGFVYIYDESQKDYKHIGLNDWLLDDYVITDIINDEVEILETTITYKQDNKIKKLEEKTSEIRFAIQHLGIETVLSTYSSKINEIINKLYGE